MNPRDRFIIRKERTRAKLRRVSTGLVRLCVYRSNNHIEAQLIDDAKGCTLAHVSSAQKAFSGINGANCSGAEAVGKEIAKAAKSIGLERVYFDRGGYAYHGRVKALTDAAREHGLGF